MSYFAFFFFCIYILVYLYYNATAIVKENDRLNIYILVYLYYNLLAPGVANGVPYLYSSLFILQPDEQQRSLLLAAFIF